MRILFDNQVVIVTGGSEGIGRAIAVQFAAAGAKVVIASRRPEPAAAVVAEIADAGGQALAIPCDVADSSAVDAMVQQTLDTFGRVDVLVNNAGVGGGRFLVADLPEEIWSATMNVNLTGAFHCCRAVLKAMEAQQSGRIINIASMAGRRVSNSGAADYATSKHGLIGLTKQIAFEAAQWSVTANVICPGTVITPMIRQARGENAEEKLAEQVPLGRVAQPDDIAHATLFFASEQAAMITGATLDIDGGQWLGVQTDYPRAIKRRTRMSRMKRRDS